MIRCEVVNENFTLQKFDELKNIQRKSREENGKLFKGDTFECNKEMAKYLSGDNPLGKVVVKVIEILPKEKPIRQILSQSPVEELEKASKIESVTITGEFKVEKAKPKKKKSSKK